MAEAYFGLTHWLFAVATAMLEDAVEVAVASRSSRLDSSRLAAHGHRLRAAAHDIDVIAEVTMIAAKLSVNHASDGQKDLR